MLENRQITTNHIHSSIGPMRGLPYFHLLAVVVVVSADVSAPIVVYSSSSPGAGSVFTSATLSMHNQPVYHAGVPNATAHFTGSTLSVLDVASASPTASLAWTSPAGNASVFSWSARHVGALDDGAGLPTTPGTPDVLVVHPGATSTISAYAATGHQGAAAWSTTVGAALSERATAYSDDGTVVAALYPSGWSGWGHYQCDPVCVFALFDTVLLACVAVVAARQALAPCLCQFGMVRRGS